jgi:hypothetical protein
MMPALLTRTRRRDAFALRRGSGAGRALRDHCASVRRDVWSGGAHQVSEDECGDDCVVEWSHHRNELRNEIDR